MQLLAHLPLQHREQPLLERLLDDGDAGRGVDSAVSHVLPVRLLLSTSSGIGGGATTVLAIAASTSALVCGAILVQEDRANNPQYAGPNLV